MSANLLCECDFTIKFRNGFLKFEKSLHTPKCAFKCQQFAILTRRENKNHKKNMKIKFNS